MAKGRKKTKKKEKNEKDIGLCKQSCLVPNISDT